MSRKPRSPLVVFDWNFVQSVSLKQFNPPQDWDFLLPDEVVHEVVEKPDEAKIGAPELFRKLLKISSLCRSRIWLARPTDCFINYSRPLRVSQLVSAPGTEAFRKEIRSGSDRSDLVPIGRSSKPHDEFKKGRCEFRDLVLEYSKRFQTTRPTDANIVNDISRCTELVRKPGLLRNPVRAEDKQRPSLTDAQRAAFPDALPWCRWTRLCCWYALRYAARATGPKMVAKIENDKIENDFADANYAFLSSYTGYLLTNDRGCQDAARALRPDVRIWSWDTVQRRLEIA